MIRSFAIVGLMFAVVAGDCQAPVVIDVRRAADYLEDHLNCSVNLPRPGWPDQNETSLDMDIVRNLTGNDPTWPIKVHCYKGVWSSEVLLLLQTAGFRNAANGGGFVENPGKPKIYELCDNSTRCRHPNTTSVIADPAKYTTIDSHTDSDTANHHKWVGLIVGVLVMTLAVMIAGAAFFVHFRRRKLTIRMAVSNSNMNDLGDAFDNDSDEDLLA
eukprot:m.82870 g.82870  ORF g.82870 m.82870 type:complete len:215 (-) comp25565_c0_seq2:443-1087(-)